MPYDAGVAAQTPLAAALERVGDRWSLLLIEALLDGPRRFGELAESVHGIAPNILSERLKRLEGERILRATPYSERPPRFTYALTDNLEAELRYHDTDADVPGEQYASAVVAGISIAF